MNYVKEYQRLDKQVEGDQWRLARLASEAVSEGAHTQASFAKAVGKSQVTISRQCRIWTHYYASDIRPPFADAWAWSVGTTAAAESDRKQISNARSVLRDPDLARELLADPKVRAVASEAISAHQRASAPKAKAPSGDDAFLRCADEMARTEQSLIRLVENLNEGRKNGFLSPSVLREFTEKLRLYAEAIDDIAGSRGLTDEALAEWIGAE